MAKLMKSFIGQIGGIAGRVTGSDTYEAEVDKASRIRESPVESKLSLSGSEEADLVGGSSSNEEDGCGQQVPSMKGTLNKWTNYLHGWQERYFVVAEGILSYYKSEFDTQFGCRGSISLHKAKILLHEFDELRLDIRAHDCSYFLRASSVHEKERWVEAIEANKKCVPDNGIDSAIRRQGSMLSLSGLSQTSSSSFKVGQDLASKVMELETYRDILCRQVDLLQAYFDSLAEGSATPGTGAESASNGISTSVESIDETPEKQQAALEIGHSPSAPATPSASHSHRVVEPNASHHSPLPSRFNPKAGHRRTGSDPFAFRPAQFAAGRGYARGHTPHFSVGSGAPTDFSTVDFKGEAITFKATTAGIISSLSYCIDIMNKREDYWQKKFEKEQDHRRKAEVAAHSALNGPRVRAFEYAGPDFEEGPHSALNEDEFFDALEMAYQKDEMGPNPVPAAVEKERNTEQQQQQQQQTSEENSTAVPLMEEISHQSLTGVEHRLTSLVDEKVSRYATYMFEPLDTSLWSVTHEEEDMKVYRRELEEDNVVIDPLRASYTIPGVSAKEVIQHFFDKDTRLSWDGMVETVEVVETLAEDTLIFHQLHKRVWPSTQRETLFCSHLCTLTNAPAPENIVGHTWMVCNFSLDHDKVPSTSKLIRATLYVGLVCQTVTCHPVTPGKEAELSREEISCKLVYAANVNPGGWAPAAVVRTIAKRELCNFIKTFSASVQNKVSSTPVTL